MGALIFVIVISIVGIILAIKKWRKTEVEMRKQSQFSSAPAPTPVSPTAVDSSQIKYPKLAVADSSCNSNSNKSSSCTTTSVQSKCTIPSRIDNLYLIYSYTNIKFNPSDRADEISSCMKKENRFELDISQDGDLIHVLFDGSDFGTIVDRTDMIRDWLKKSNTIRCWLKKYSQAENILALAFYRDEHARLSYRESGVYKLTRYSNEDAQFELSYTHDGDKVDLLEDSFDEDVVLVEGIGSLPKRAAQRFIENGAEAAFIDHIDYDDEKDKYIPYVKIYW